MGKQKEVFSILDDSEVRVEEPKESCFKKRLFISCLIATGIMILIAGTAFATYTIRFSHPCEKATESSFSSPCEYSKEAQRIGLEDLLQRMKTTLVKYHPNMIANFPGSDETIVRATFKPYNNHPLAIKEKDDASHAMYEEIASLSVDEKKLKARERKALAQLRYFYKHSFGQPGNYYTGEWMMGPNLFCWQAICLLGNDLGFAMDFAKPRSLDDISKLKKKLQEHEQAIMQYLRNIRQGVQAGMVGSTEECQAGIDGFKQRYIHIATARNGSGILKEWFVEMSVNKETFLSQLSDEEKKKWKQSHNQTVKESIHEYIIKHVGDPLTELIRYLEEDHLRHCVPANVSSGFISRPVAFVYTDGKANRSQPTTGRLPTGELLNGKKSYDYFLSFFLSTNMTAAEVHRIGRQQIDKIYPEIIELAKNVTKESNDNQALEKFKKLISSRDTYFNSEPFPANESDKNAQEKCTSNEKAAQFCPQRWKSMQKWFSMAKEVMSTILPKTIKFFYFTGQNSSVPACPLELQVDFNPSSAAPSYLSSSHDCTWTCKYNIPFFLDNMGPKYTETTTSSHEASPGHHTQVQGAMENFADRCGGLIGWLNSNVQSYALSEGWGLYSESPLIAEETDSYQNEPLQKYGMLKMQMWRAIRMVVDTGLHSMGMTRDEALELFTKYAWDSTDMAFKEVSRYQSSPGQATCYMVGQLEIQRLRKFAEEKLGNKFDLREFHYHLLSQDSAPLFYMESHIQFFVACKLQEYKPEGCSQLFQDKNVDGKTQRSMNVRQHWPLRQVIHRYW